MSNFRNSNSNGVWAKKLFRIREKQSIHDTNCTSQDFGIRAAKTGGQRLLPRRAILS